ncbi:hypothetical protein TRIP_B50314 [uncultured Desulfatiglans sp.]|nr:hypothetical protein TRIP_B50314 [uncultured Desulfatiglans sp.]
MDQYLRMKPARMPYRDNSGKHYKLSRKKRKRYF